MVLLSIPSCSFTSSPAPGAAALTPCPASENPFVITEPTPSTTFPTDEVMYKKCYKTKSVTTSKNIDGTKHN